MVSPPGAIDTSGPSTRRTAANRSRRCAASAGASVIVQPPKYSGAKRVMGSISILIGLAVALLAQLLLWRGSTGVDGLVLFGLAAFFIIRGLRAPAPAAPLLPEPHPQPESTAELTTPPA